MNMRAVPLLSENSRRRESIVALHQYEVLWKGRTSSVLEVGVSICVPLAGFDSSGVRPSNHSYSIGNVVGSPPWFGFQFTTSMLIGISRPGAESMRDGGSVLTLKVSVMPTPSMITVAVSLLAGLQPGLPSTST